MNINIEGLKKLGKSLYPDYKGRKFDIRFSAEYTMEDYWSGGTRYYVKAIVVKDGQLGITDHRSGNPLTDAYMHQRFMIPANVILVERCFFCGKDLGIRFIFSKAVENEISFSGFEKAKKPSYLFIN